MRALLLTFVCACSFSGTGMTVPIDAAPGDGAADDVDARDVDAKTIDAAPIDTDNDDVFDGDDNCPMTANTDQHDEDGDGAGDACDACPTIANQPPMNTDGDALPDACDPHPTTLAGDDRIEKLWTFADTAAGIPTDWKYILGDAASFSMSNDKLHIVAGGTQLIAFNTTFENMSVEIGVEVESIAAGTSFLDVLVDLETNGAEYFACGFRFDRNEREIFDFMAMAFAQRDVDTTAPAVTGSTYRMTFVSEAGAQRCSSSKVGGGAIDLSNAQTRRGNRHMGIRAGKTTASVRYVALYRY